MSQPSHEKSQELLILDTGGQIVYYNTDQKESNERSARTILAASYLTAILKFAQAATKGDIISSFELGKSRIFLKLGESLPVYYVIIIGKKKFLRERKIKARLNAIAQEFENRFSTFDLEEWDGSTDYFDVFDPVVSNILHF